MQRILIGTALVAILAACSDTNVDTSTLTFDEDVTLFTADKIYTGVTANPEIAGLAVNAEGVIVATLPRGAEIAARTPNGAAPVISLQGVMYPGFVDGHAHLIGIGQRELTLDLAGTPSIADLQATISEEVAEAANGDVIFGRGWIETDWPEGRMPTSADLDAVAPDNPVILIRADGHALVANSAAMTAAGIDATTPSPDGGAIERDASGAATGIFVDNAMGLVRQLIETPDEADIAEALQTGAEVYASRGWTGLHNMSVGADQAPLMAALDEAGNLPQRIHNNFNPGGFEIAANRQYETDTIQNRAVKIYMDGALGSRGALLFEPYTDRPDTRGLALRGKEETVELMTRAYNADVQIALHAIGDKANSDGLDWMNEAVAIATADLDLYKFDHRWRIEHAQILTVEDIALFSDGGNIIASMQPSHAIGDLKFAPDRLGLERLAGAYAWQGVLDAGGVVVGGSDAPVEVGSPMIEFYAAVARKALDGTSGEGWHPEQAVSREDALAMFTSAPAFASFQEDVLGTLEVGKIADLSVFDLDLMTVPEAEILEATATATVIAGEIVWQADK